MQRKPNETHSKMNSNAGSKGTNQIGLQFREAFRVLLDPGYYEGTKFAQYYSEMNSDGRSNVYVPDKYEAELENFYTTTHNEMKYLVGLTGMGKTTLIRNYFRITDRDIKIYDNDYIIYISFYYSHLSTDRPQQSVEKEIASYLIRFCKEFFKKHPYLLTDKVQFYTGLYNYIIDSKPTLLSQDELTPKGIDFTKLLNSQPEWEDIKEELEQLNKNKAIEYYSCLIKYILSLINEPYRFTLIFDDIESKDSVFHYPVIEAARHMFSCFCATTNDGGTTKILVALRAYTFRCNIGRTAEARREAVQNNVILKRNTVSLHDIFEARFNAIEGQRIKKKAIINLISYQKAREEFLVVEKALKLVGSDLIYNISNYNLADAMLAYSSVLVNAEWIPCGETMTDGAFALESDNYRITKYNLLRALSMENSVFFDGSSNNIPNIVQYDGIGTELFCIYVIRYMKLHGIVNVYGNEYVVGRDLADKLTGTFSTGRTPGQLRDQLHNHFTNAINYLYDKGILFRSLYDIEEENKNQIKRQYADSYKLYLSPKGETIYGMLSDNSVLMEIFRDDIETDLDRNDELTYNMSTYQKFKYILEYLDAHFNFEKRMIAQAVFDMDSYIETLGSDFVTAYLLMGLIKNYKSYFNVKGKEEKEIQSSIEELIQSMNMYANKINDRFGCNLSLCQMKL